MKESPFPSCHVPHPPEWLKQQVLNGCVDAFLEPLEFVNQPRRGWFDWLLQAAAVAAVVLFVLNCWSSFAIDHSVIQSARFSTLDPVAASLKGKSTSMMVIRRSKTWF